MLPNEVFALGCRAYYESIGLIVDASNGEFAHSPLTRKECDTGYYLLHGHHQHQGLLQSKDLGKLCFFNGDAKKWLVECDYFPEGYFELWDIYEKYAKGNAKKLHEGKNEFGRSALAIRMNEKIHTKKDELGRSVVGVKAAAATHAKKDEFGRSLEGVKASDRLNSQGWVDPDHPELGVLPSGPLARKQKSRGYSYGKENRVRVY